MLYMPWRNDEKDLIYGCHTFKEKYEQLRDIIQKNRCCYEFHANILEKASQDLDNLDECNEYGNVAPNVQHIDEQDSTGGQTASTLFDCFDPGTDKQHAQYDLLDDIGIFPRSSQNEELVLNRMGDADFRKLYSQVFK